MTLESAEESVKSLVKKYGGYISEQGSHKGTEQLLQRLKSI